MFDKTRKNTPHYFLSWKYCLFSQKMCFQQPLRCYRSGIITSIVIVRVPVAPLQIVPWGFAHSILRKKKAKGFCHLEDSLFLKCLFLTISCVLKKKTYSLHNRWQKTFSTPINCSLTFIMCDTTRKSRPIFCSLERLPLFKNLCFQQLPGLKELSLLLPQSMLKNLVDSYKLFPEVCHARYYQKNGPKTFVTVKTIIF